MIKGTSNTSKRLETRGRGKRPAAARTESVNTSPALQVVSGSTVHLPADLHLLTTTAAYALSYHIVSWLVSWCFEPSQPQRITSGLKTNFSLSPSLSHYY